MNKIKETRIAYISVHKHCEIMLGIRGGIGIGSGIGIRRQIGSGSRSGSGSGSEISSISLSNIQL